MITLRPSTIAIMAALGVSFTFGMPTPVIAQDEECMDLQGTPPGLYVTVDQSQVYLIKDGKVVELQPGEAAYANESQLGCLKVPPRMLSWPCDSTEALARKMAPGYAVADLPAGAGAQEISRRYFEDNQVITPDIEWLNGEIHGHFPAPDIESFDTGTYWYLPGSEDPFASPKRPRAQLVALFWATKQAVVDTHTLTALETEHPDGELPVVFVFASDREVPVSFFGRNPTLKQVTDAYLEKGIELAPVPMWYAGDHHLEVTLEELENQFEIPALGDVPADRQAAIRAELEAFGFFHKPLAVSVLAETGNTILDQPEVVRVAADMGIRSFPVVMFYFSGSSHLAGCGVELPQVSVTGGATSSEGGGGVVTPGPFIPQLPPPERNPSDS